jgi:hypothetical protein
MARRLATASGRSNGAVPRSTGTSLSQPMPAMPLSGAPSGGVLSPACSAAAYCARRRGCIARAVCSTGHRVTARTRGLSPSRAWSRRKGNAARGMPAARPLVPLSHPASLDRLGLCTSQTRHATGPARRLERRHARSALPRRDVVGRLACGRAHRTGRRARPRACRLSAAPSGRGGLARGCVLSIHALTLRPRPCAEGTAARRNTLARLGVVGRRRHTRADRRYR